MNRPFSLRFLLTAGLLAVLTMGVLAGCSGQNVRHLAHETWGRSGDNHIGMQFWRFGFTTVDMGDSVGVIGTALPNSELYPQWAAWYGQLTITAYLSDHTGQVIARDTHTYVPRPIGKERGIPLEFTFDAGTVDAQYISFGYRMLLT